VAICARRQEVLDRVAGEKIIKLDQARSSFEFALAGLKARKTTRAGGTTTPSSPAAPMPGARSRRAVARAWARLAA
jgi:hypothetical protein